MERVEVALRLAAGALLILTNGYFVAIEFALTRARQFEKEEFLDGHPGLERAWEMTHDLEIYLTTCQVGITGSSIAVGIVAEPALAALFEPYFQSTALASIGAGGLLAFLIINLVHLTHGEQTPTYLGVERSQQVAKYGAPPLYWFHWVLSPLITFGDWIAKATLRLLGVEMTGAWLETETDRLESRAELRNRLGSLLEAGELPSERREEVLNALDVDEITVEEIMTPREDVVTMDTTLSSEENLDRVRHTPHARFPLVGGSLEDFEGVIYAPSILNEYEGLREGTVSLESIAAPPLTIEVATSVSEAFDRFQEEDQELALVRSGDSVVGLVTATDALEAVMGQLRDPLDKAYDDRGYT